MRVLAIFLLLASLACAEELEAYVSDLKGAGYTGDYQHGKLSATNCKGAGLTSQFEVTVVRDPSCKEASVILGYSYYDFADAKWTDWITTQCSITSMQSCWLTVPIRLGGNGTGLITQDLIKVRLSCGGKTYEKTFNYQISHAPIDTETSVASKLNDAEAKMQYANALLQVCSCCGSNISQKISDAQNALNAGREKLKRCELQDAMNSGESAFALANDAATVVAGVQCPSQPPANQTQPPPNMTQPPANHTPKCTKTCAPNERLDLGSCACIPTQITTAGPAANQTTKTPSPCPVGFILYGNPPVVGVNGYIGFASGRR